MELSSILIPLESEPKDKLVNEPFKLAVITKSPTFVVPVN